MDLTKGTVEKCSPQAEIAAYLDGELKPAEELALEFHFANCKNCLEELNLQKQLLGALDFAFEEKTEIELPEDFAKVVATHAESGVSGLRSKEERYSALLVCSALFLVVLIGLGAQAGNGFEIFSSAGEKIIAVITFIGHFVYDFAVGTAIILRSLSRQFISNSVPSSAFIIILFTILIIALSRLVLRFNRS